MAISTWYDLLNAVAGAIGGVANLPPAVVRKLAGDLPDDTLPSCIVAKLGPEEYVESNFAQQDHYRYPVGIFVVDRNDREFDVMPSYTELREALRQQLDQRPNGQLTVTGIYDVTLTPLDLNDGNPNAVYDVTGFRADYDIWETRTTV